MQSSALDVAPTLVWKNPASHAAHTESPPGEKLPGWQSTISPGSVVEGQA